jgi:hypothetical protein
MPRHSEKHTKLCNAVVLLGAGASYNLGFPLQSDIWGFLESKSLYFSRRAKSLKQMYGDNIEVMFSLMQLENEDSTHRMREVQQGTNLDMDLTRMKNELGKIFESTKINTTAFVEYRNLIEVILESFSNTTFISLNWDTALEKVLSSLNRKIDYFQSFDSKIDSYDMGEYETVVLKPHGSINWKFCVACKRYFLMEKPPVEVMAIKTNVVAGSGTIKPGVSVEDLHEELHKSKCADAIECTAHVAKKNWRQSLEKVFDGEILHHENSGWVFDPICPVCEKPGIDTVIVPPSSLKSVKLEPENIVSRKAHQALEEVDYVIIIGYSFRDADYDMGYLFSSAWTCYDRRIIFFDNIVTAKRILERLRVRSSGEISLDSKVGKNFGYLKSDSAERLKKFLKSGFPKFTI